MLTKQKAFTLIELLVTMSVLIVLVGLALPSFKQLIANNRSVALGENLVGAINFARTEAIKRAKAITICPMDDAKADCGSNWKNGWFVVVDTAATETTKPPVVADSTAILKRWEGINNTSVITLGGSRTFIRFTSTGTLARTEGNAAAVITAQVGKCRNDSARVVTVAVSGMLTTKHSQCL